MQNQSILHMFWRTRSNTQDPKYTKSEEIIVAFVISRMPINGEPDA